MGVFGMAASYLAFATLHFFQFVLAITVCGLYGVDLSRASKAGVRSDSRWVYAEVVGALSALTALLLMVPFFLRFAAVWVWNVVLFILWIALFGVFASLFIHEDPEGNGDIQRMKNAVWVDLVNALLWLFTALGHFVYWFRHRERVSRFTGRARV
ncbi:uncharacterized protein E0L32_009103 [Thyridium curvatum]|uniref:MARVEL domain-containing protein n=1 Tax=Thyridium curvatum TaxID=1093900 RepID=A0A507ATE9_9PEZI|nr:uncharacterized protein E0L32_009103 [Thyridium curvatum]TPX09764.1 hypothetical protein E0L32_009103 [Thyridium curvatum]